MKESGFYGEMRRKADPVWKAVLDHPFVRGIGDGTLSRERFEFYLKQDYVYLMDFGRVFALAAAKSRTMRDMGKFAGLLDLTLNTEMELHRRTCKAFGIGERELEETRGALVTSAYANMLLRTCYEGGFSDILAVLLPCECGYAEIGRRLKTQGLPENLFYRDWIDTYSSPEFTELADGLVDRMNEHAADAPARSRERWHRLYETSARYECLFFDMSWKMEEWS